MCTNVASVQVLVDIVAYYDLKNRHKTTQKTL